MYCVCTNLHVRVICTCTYVHVKSIAMAPLYLSAVWLVCSAVLELLSGRTTETQLPRNSLQAIEETTCNTGGLEV